MAFIKYEKITRKIHGTAPTTKEEAIIFDLISGQSTMSQATKATGAKTSQGIYGLATRVFKTWHKKGLLNEVERSIKDRL